MLTGSKHTRIYEHREAYKEHYSLMLQEFDNWFDGLKDNIDTEWRNEWVSPCYPWKWVNQYCAFVVCSGL